ncbi:unnamed protein product, partial [Mesorhabditis belari]|uniref:EF-hand domain-containing protein n=1 Tax=Mesorhabditis belari TaxID=2138241 RepID=A0AAF3E817_9BILA
MPQTSSRTRITRKEVEAAFAMCNPQKPETINIQDLKVIMRALGFDPRNEEVERLTKKVQNTIKRVKGDKDEALLTVDQFLDLMKERLESDKSTEEMRCAFKLFDRDGKGWIDLEDLKRVSNELGEDIKQNDLIEMLKEAEADPGQKGRVDEEAFFRIMKRTCLY